MKASPDGRKLAVAVRGNSRPLDLFDFDAATGTLTNYVNLGNLFNQFGVSFSPDNSKLYATNVDISRLEKREVYPDNITQYDMLAGDSEAIIASAQSIIMDNPSFNKPGERGIGGGYNDLQIAPDGKIYMIGTNFMISATSYGHNYVIVIHDPNKKGFASKPRYTTLTFGGQIIDAGLPNFIQSYFNGLEPLSCPLAEDCDLAMIGLYPNPTKGTVRFTDDGACGEMGDFNLRILNSIGQEVTQERKGLKLDSEIDISGYAAGLYLFILTFADNQQLVKKVVKVN